MRFCSANKNKQTAASAAVAATAVRAASSALVVALLLDVVHDEVVQVVQAALAETRIDRGAGTVVGGAGVHHPGLPVDLATAWVHTLCPWDMGFWGNREQAIIDQAGGNDVTSWGFCFKRVHDVNEF